MITPPTTGAALKITDEQIERVFAHWLQKCAANPEATAERAAQFHLRPISERAAMLRAEFMQSAAEALL